MQTRGGDMPVLLHGGGAVRQASPDMVAAACRAEEIDPPGRLVDDLVSILNRRLVMVDAAPTTIRNDVRDDASARRSRQRTPAQEIETAARRLLTALGGPEGVEIEQAARWYFQDRTGRTIDLQDVTTFLVILSECQSRLFHTEKPAAGFYCVIREINDAMAASGVHVTKAALARMLSRIHSELPGAVFSMTHTNFDKVVRAALMEPTGG